MNDPRGLRRFGGAAEGLYNGAGTYTKALALT